MFKCVLSRKERLARRHRRQRFGDQYRENISGGPLADNERFQVPLRMLVTVRAR